MDPTAYLASTALKTGGRNHPTPDVIDAFYQDAGWHGFAALAAWRRWLRARRDAPPASGKIAISTEPVSH